MKTHQKNGFTILEVLFVVAIMGVMASLGACFYKNHVDSFKTQKTALQMQQWLQAGSAYYVNNSCWPSSSDGQTVDCQNQPVNDFTPYIPAGNTTSPWGDNYTYTPVNNVAGKNMLFQVSVPVLTPETAQKVAALLPNEKVEPCKDDPAKTCVIAQVTIPGERKYDQVQIGGIGTVTDGGVISAHCPGSTKQPNFYFATSGFSTTLYDKRAFGYLPVGQLNITLDPKKPCSHDGDNWLCYVTTQITGYDPKTSGDVKNGQTEGIYIAVCQ
jgi:prepilin-type N-terminal cleavage/methylation domain-containing protein